MNIDYDVIMWIESHVRAGWVLKEDKSQGGRS